MKKTYFPPKYDETGFSCPICGVYAQQQWRNVSQLEPNRGFRDSPNLRFSVCSHCSQAALWYKQVCIDPATSSIPSAHPDLPQELLADYEEARAVASQSPRSAAALLRLCLQKLCKNLGQSGKHIDKDIMKLVELGLPVEVQQALDIIRVVGNEQVHPGTLDVRDNGDIVEELFVLINFIVENRITQPREIAELYRRLPSTKREAIEVRDAKSMVKIDVD